MIVIDANVLVASPFLLSKEWSSLVDHATEWGIEIVVPDVALMEAVNVVRRNWASKRQKLDDLDLGVFGLDEAKLTMLAEIDHQSIDYEKWLRARLDEVGVTIAATPPIDHMEIARRASEGRPPYSKDKDGYRDTVIWYSVLAIARRNPGADVWFVSDNHDDFGPKPGDWTGERSGKRDDCPIMFHTHLVAELRDCGLDERVFYVVSLARIEQHLASQFAPINDIELAKLVRSLDIEALAEKLFDALIDLTVDPEECALPLGVLAAKIVGSRKVQEGWNFSEAAGRGEAGWTARFSVDTEVDIAMAGAPSADSEHTKILRLVGQATVSPMGALLDIAVDSAKALPDDPMRDRWLRRASRDPESLAETLARLQAASAGMVGTKANLGNLAGLAGLSEQITKNYTGLAGLAGLSEQITKNYTGLAGLAGLSEQITKNYTGLAGIREQMMKNYTGLIGISERVTKGFADLSGLPTFTGQIRNQIRKAMENPGAARNAPDQAQRRPESGVTDDGDDGEPSATN